MNKTMKMIALVTGLAVVLILPYTGIKSYYLHIAILGLINAILALGLNLIAGYTGQLSLAQAAFFGIGSYTTGLLMLNYKMSFWLAAPAGILFSALVAVLIGLPTLRLKGPYFVISTLGFGEIVRLIFLNWEQVTHGPNGLSGIPSPDDINLFFFTLNFDTKIGAYYLIVAALAIILFLYNNATKSRIGRALRAIKHDNIAAEVMGINLTFYKVFAFACGAGLSGAAGALYTGYIRFISPDTFTVGEAINILIMMVLGGMGTIVGPIIGAITITYLLESMRVFAEYRLIIYGLLMYVVILYLPGGLISIIDYCNAAIGNRFSKKTKIEALRAKKTSNISETADSEV